MASKIKCPRCSADSFNRYGKTANGKQRYICLVCNRQFAADSRRVNGKTRPLCPICGKKMHVYVTEKDATRYRCSNYPECKSFVKVERKRDFEKHQEAKGL
jgi:transposase-like protein